MNWKKLLLALVGLGLALVLITSILLGLLAAAGVATVAAVADAIDEAGGITVTDGSGESISLDIGEEGSLSFSDGDGETFSIDVSEAGRIRFSERGGDSATVELDVPRITVTEGESGHARVIAPAFDDRFPSILSHDGRITVHVPDNIHYRNDFFLAPVSFFFRMVTVLAGIGLLAVGGYILLKNRQQAPKEPKSA